ncbi:MAG TPA: hypothetical protein ENI15_09855 [Spirochaetes bacterium]|nr:hypothetical protein [Spirochaetota bacterium]
MKTQRIERNEYFSPGRFFFILKRDFLSNYRTILITIGAIAAFVILTSTVSALNHRGEEFHTILYFLLLYIGGFIISSRAFREMYNSRRSFTYITLPGSQLEKFIGRLISTSIGYVLGTLIIYSAVAAVSEIINQLLFGYTHAFLNPFTKVFLIGCAAFVVVQSLFLTGAVFFKKNSLIKTVLMLMVLTFAILVIVILSARFIFPGFFKGINPVKQEFQSLQELTEWLGITEDRLRTVAKSAWIVIKVLYWAVLAPLCWTVSYFKFRKVEV